MYRVIPFLFMKYNTTQISFSYLQTGRIFAIVLQIVDNGIAATLFKMLSSTR